MINISNNMKSKYAGTFFGAMVLRGFQPSVRGGEAFRSFAANELDRIRRKYPD